MADSDGTTKNSSPSTQDSDVDRRGEGPLIIGLTGSIAAGKSTVAAILVERGAVHCDADKLVHKMYDPGTPGFDKVVAHFGQDVVGPDGYVDRKILGAKVFGKPEEMAALTRAMGNISEAIHLEILKWRDALPKDGIAVMEAVNLLEPGYAHWTDQAWLIGVDDDIARKRLIETRNMSPEEAEQRVKAMRPFSERQPGTDWSYKNNGTPEELRSVVNAELDRILALYRAGNLPTSVFDVWFEDYKEKNKERIAAAAAARAAAAAEAEAKAKAGA